MFRFLKSKLRSKKWLNASLLLGIILLTAVVTCHPMFMQGSLNKLLDNAFQEHIIEENEYPIVLNRNGAYQIEKVKSTDVVMEKLTAYQNKWTEYLGLDILATQTRLKLTGCVTEGSYGAKNKYFDISYLTDMDAHINIVKGTGLEEAQAQQGIYPCLISTRVMDNYELTCGEIVTFKGREDASGNPIQMQIVGIFEESDASDIYWFQTTSEFQKELFVSKETMEELMPLSGFDKISFAHHVMLDYTQITGQNADDIQYYTNEFLKSDKNMSENFLELLETYQKDAQTVATLLWVLELPMLLLLLAFIYMVSGQILQMETGEIAMMKSRGVSRGEVIKLYIEQSGVLSVIGIILGIPVGFMLCKLAASTNSFLVFTMKDTSAYGLVWQVIPYSVGAALVAMLCMTIPVFGYSKLSIVQQKSMNKKQDRKMFWEHYFLDILLLAVSVYLLYNYNHQKEMIATNVLAGESLDPMIFINASLFMLACGLLVLRLIHYLVNIIFYLGRKKWSPAMYASFLQITRSFRKQGFISIFLVMTLAMGIFNSNMVRTINENETERITYNIGTDAVFAEKWKMMIYKPDRETTLWMYPEPDYERFSDLKEKNICESMTRVIVDENVKISAGNKGQEGSLFMAINTKEFGETATLKEGLNDSHWYNALNALAKTSNGAIISSNVAKEYELSVGDSVSCTRISPVSDTDIMGKMTCTIVAIVDAWPGFNGYNYSYNEDGELVETGRYLLVCNYAYAINVFTKTPYQVWMKLAPDRDPDEVSGYLEEQQIVLDSMNSVKDSMEELHNTPIIQITNGMYTLSFLVAIILCLAGFLIYWITSIKQRELLFGIYRAMGMNMRELNKMLMNEQVFSSLLAVLGGTGVGILATSLFVKLVAIVYLPEHHNIALQIFSNGWDMVRLFIVIAVMFVVCLIVLRTILKNMKIAQALKLGED